VAKFSNAKIGDRAWNIMHGWGTIVAIKENEDYPICFKADIDSFCTFDLDGKRYITDKYPTLFWNEFHIPSDEEDKKPFNLVDFLRDNLEPREFRWDTNNIELHFSHRLNKWKWTCSGVYQSIGVVYFRDRDNDIFHYIVDTLNENKVTLTQLKKAYLELGWL
jgi:hypothetical protein